MSNYNYNENYSLNCVSWVWDGTAVLSTSEMGSWCPGIAAWWRSILHKDEDHRISVMGPFLKVLHFLELTQIQCLEIHWGSFFHERSGFWWAMCLSHCVLESVSLLKKSLGLIYWEKTLNFWKHCHNQSDKKITLNLKIKGKKTRRELPEAVSVSTCNCREVEWLCDRDPEHV